MDTQKMPILMNCSNKDIERLIREHARIKVKGQKKYIQLTGKETLRLASGGKMIFDKNGHKLLENEKEPAGINLEDGTFVGLPSIEQIIENGLINLKCHEKLRYNKIN